MRGWGQRIYFRDGEDGSTLADADTIKDFTAGADDFGLVNGLQYIELTTALGTGSAAVKPTRTSKRLLAQPKSDASSH